MILWWWACAPSDLPEGRVEVADALVAASEIRAPLDVPCAEARASDGPFDVEIDDRSGWTVVLDRGAGWVWLRDPWGVVPDRCWWLPLEGADPAFPAQACAPDGRQRGACGADAEAPAHWRFATPGVLPSDGASDVVALDGVLWGARGDAVARWDLTATADPPADAGEGPSTRLAPLPPLAPGGGFSVDQVARAGAQVVMYDAHRGRIEVLRRDIARKTLDGERSSRQARADGVLAAGGDVAVVAASHGVDRFVGLGNRPRRQRLDHQALRAGIVAAGVRSADGLVAVALPAQVIGWSTDDAVHAWPLTGVQGLFSGDPGGVPTLYAWGNDVDGGFIARLDDDNVAREVLRGGRLLGAGGGEVFQEIVVVEDTDPPVVRSLVDPLTIAAIPEGHLGLALAAFLESPKDPDLLDAGAAATELQAIGGCPTEPSPGLERYHAVCCAQAARGARADAQLSWLDERLRGDRPLAVVLGVSPTAIEVSRRCLDVGQAPLDDMSAALPVAFASWSHRWRTRGVGSSAIFLHSAPFDPDAWWVGCPEGWPSDVPPAASCWDRPRTAAEYRRFYQDLAAAASVRPWATMPDVTLIGGGFGPALADGTDWTDVLGDLVLPDGDPAEDGLYFGNLGMDPRAPEALSKELAPDDARARPFPVNVASPADRWDSGIDAAGVVYWPGQTFAIEYLYELRRSGLLMQEFIQHVSLATDWSAPAFPGGEAQDIATAADFALTEHYLVTRVLAHRDLGERRWWTLHLGDLSRLRGQTLADGWMDCEDADCARTSLDVFADRMDAWPAFAWRPRP